MCWRSTEEGSAQFRHRKEALLEGIMLQLDAQGQRELVRPGGMLRVDAIRMQGTSGLGTARAKAESLERV